MTLHRGQRVSAATAYLHPARHRPNLTIVSHAMATRIRVRDGRAAGIDWLRHGRRDSAEAAHEVILCAGVTRTPQLLMLMLMLPAPPPC
ncbi:GMC family oxidoreductase N-terminal domain-containing protein [Sphingobium sufflavum]|uniref:GMC family oxidoreductase N-terminal domain-containing protein n=1 Tax=Sphingobium sufflavum TaxID=1129547 RepID=UPI00389B2588